MATVKNIFIDQGSTFTLSLTATDSAGDPINLSGYSVSAQLRKSFSSTNYYNFDASITGSTGNILLTLSATTSATAQYGRYMYDVFITNGSTNEVTRIVQGTAIIDPQVTR